MGELTPVWLLDVDGVLNAVRPGWDGRTARQGVPAGGIVYPMTWAPALVDRLVRLHQGGGVEIRWSTTWVDEIAGVEAAMGLPGFPVAFSDPVLGTASVEAKEQAALHVVEHEGRPLIWTDDTAIPPSGPVRDRLTASGRPLLLVAPDSRHGLQPEDLDTVASFLAGQRRRAVARSEDGL